MEQELVENVSGKESQSAEYASGSGRDAVTGATNASVPNMAIVKRNTEMINTERIITSMMYHLSVFVTFGLCNPYLAITILLTVITSCYDWVFVIGRFVLSRNACESNAQTRAWGDDNSSRDGSSRRDSNISRELMDTVDAFTGDKDMSMVRLNLALMESEKSLARCVWPLIWTSSTFFGFLCLDMAGEHSKIIYTCNMVL